MTNIRLSMSIAFIVILALILAGPFILHWKSHDPSTHVFKLGEYGAWLQGALTPGVVILAFVTLYNQISSLNSALKSQRETNAIQREANKQLLMGIILDNIERFQGHLNYLAFAAFYNERRSRDVMEPGRMYYINLLLKPDQTPHPGEHAENLKKDLCTIISLAKESGTTSFLDKRIIDLDTRLNIHNTPEKGSED